MDASAAGRYTLMSSNYSTCANGVPWKVSDDPGDPTYRLPGGQRLASGGNRRGKPTTSPLARIASAQERSQGIDDSPERGGIVVGRLGERRFELLLTQDNQLRLPTCRSQVFASSSHLVASDPPLGRDRSLSKRSSSWICVLRSPNCFWGFRIPPRDRSHFTSARARSERPNRSRGTSWVRMLRQAPGAELGPGDFDASNRLLAQRLEQETGPRLELALRRLGDLSGLTIRLIVEPADERQL